MAESDRWTEIRIEQHGLYCCCGACSNTAAIAIIRIEHPDAR